MVFVFFPRLLNPPLYFFRSSLLLCHLDRHLHAGNTFSCSNAVFEDQCFQPTVHPQNRTHSYTRIRVARPSIGSNGGTHEYPRTFSHVPAQSHRPSEGIISEISTGSETWVLLSLSEWYWSVTFCSINVHKTKETADSRLFPPPPPQTPLALRPKAGHDLLILDEVSRSHTTTHNSR